MIFFYFKSFTTALKWLWRHLHIRHSHISFSCHPSDCWNFSLFHRWPLIEKSPSSWPANQNWTHFFSRTVIPYLQCNCMISDLKRCFPSLPLNDRGCVVGEGVFFLLIYWSWPKCLLKFFREIWSLDWYADIVNLAGLNSASPSCSSGQVLPKTCLYISSSLRQPWSLNCHKSPIPTIWTNWHQRNPNGADDPERRERRSRGCATSCFSAGAAKAETACVPSFPQRRRLPVAGKHLEGQQLPEEATSWGSSCQSSRNPLRV